MKKKIILTLTSVALNLALFATLIHITRIDDRYTPTPPAFFHIDHMPSWISTN
jgi:hypothetical protein